MPVFATPATMPTIPCCEPAAGVPTATVPVSCAAVNQVQAGNPTLFGSQLLTRLQSIQVQQGQCAQLMWILRDANGHPVNLDDCGVGLVPDTGSEASEISLSSVAADGSLPPGVEVVFRMKEYVLSSQRGCVWTHTATLVDITQGSISVQLTPDATRSPGIYFGEFALVYTNPETEEACTLFSNVLYVVVNRTLGGRQCYKGAPTIAEVRLQLRDSSPAESLLLNNLAFDDAEIALSTARPVEYWNEMPPPIGTYTTNNFPFRFHWLEAICGNLFLMAEEMYRRNQLPYSAGGIAVDDLNKADQYARAAQIRLQGFRDWVRQKKASINLGQAYGELGSPYY